MKDLNKRIVRELKAHIGRYLALFLIIMLGMYLVVSVAGMAETTIAGTDDYNKECNLQDGQFSVFSPLTGEQLNGLSEEFGEIEAIYSFDIPVRLDPGNNASEKVLRIFKKRNLINLVKTDSGKLPETENEIVVMNLFADRNHLEAGSEMLVAGEKYTVKGTGCVPDYNLPVRNFSDMTADPESFGIAFVTDDAYEKIKNSSEAGVEEYTYAYKLKDSSSLSEKQLTDKNRELKNAIRNLKIDYNALSSLLPGVPALHADQAAEFQNLSGFYENKDNPRIASDAASDVILKRLVSLVAGAILVMLFAYVISVFIIHQINEESSVIGTLYAMGVKKRSLITHYVILPTAVTFIAGLAGMLLGFSRLGVDFQMLDSYLYYSIPRMDKVYPLYLILYCVVMPPCISIIVNVLVINRKLSKTALSLIKNEQEGLVREVSVKGRKRSGKKHMEGNFLKQFTKRQLSRERRSVFTVVIGMIVALLIFMIGLDCFVLCSNVKKNNLSDINYEYMYVLKYPTEKVPENAEACYIKNLSVSYLGYSLDVNIIGIDNDNKYFNFKTSGNPKELVIASSTAQKYGLEVGDTMIMDDSSADRRYAFTVSGIVDYSIGLTAYMDIDAMRDFFGDEEGYFNMLVSDSELEIESNRVYSVNKRADIENAAGIFVEQMMSLVVILIAVSILIFIAVMYLMMNVMIDRAAFGISLVKIFGYRMHEIRRVYLDGNFYAVTAGAIVGIPAVKKIADLIYPYFIANTAMGMDLKFKWYIYAGILLGVILIYLTISSILTGKIKKIVPAEVLKNRE